MTIKYKIRGTHYDLTTDRNNNGIRAALYIDSDGGFEIEQFGPLDEEIISEIYISREKFEQMIGIYRTKFDNEEEKLKDEYYANSDTSIMAKLRENLLLSCSFERMTLEEIYKGLESGDLGLINKEAPKEYSEESSHDYAWFTPFF